LNRSDGMITASSSLSASLLAIDVFPAPTGPQRRMISSTSPVLERLMPDMESWVSFELNRFNRPGFFILGSLPPYF
ncbi:MAG: hypothetical protein QXD04_04485, partial [Candidatus Bathyarchaeia archaeon]